MWVTTPLLCMWQLELSGYRVLETFEQPHVYHPERITRMVNGRGMNGLALSLQSDRSSPPLPAPDGCSFEADNLKNFRWVQQASTVAWFDTDHAVMSAACGHTVS